MLSAITLGLIFAATPASPVDDAFPVPPGFEARAQFWTEAFRSYDERYAIIYDERDPGLIYAVVERHTGVKLPVGLLGDRNIQFLPSLGSARAEIADRYRTLASRNLARDRRELDDIDRRLLEPFGGFSARVETLRAAADAVRAQAGVKSRFETALDRLGPYRALVDGSLRSEGVPPDLAAIPLVETMFDVHAVSPCGATGPWQFMPLTARGTLKMSSILDERRDVELATHAAATMLRADHQALGTWPLAVTAYNTGRTRLLRAVNAAGSRDIARVVQQGDEVRGFGVQSRNYYAEFLAARAILSSLPVEASIPWDIATVSSGRDVDAARLWESCGLDPEVLALLNPAISRDALRTGFILPAGVGVHVPRGDAERVRVCLASGSPERVEPPVASASHPAEAIP